MEPKALLRCAPVLTLLLVLGACGGTVGSYFAPAAAVVDGEQIPQVTLARQLQRVVADPQSADQFRGPDGKKNRREAERVLLLRIITTRVLAHQAEKIGVGVSAEEVAAGFNDLKVQFGSEQALLTQAEKENLSLSEIRDFIRDRLLISRVESQVTKGVAVSADEVARYYEQHKDEFAEQLRAAHVLVCAQFDRARLTCATSPEDEALAAQIAARARGGEDFGRLVREFSKDTANKDAGGDLGWFGKGQMAPEFFQAASALQPGQVSDPVRTSAGFHVIKLIARGRGLDDARADIVQLLGQGPRQQAFELWLRQALSSARIEINPRFGRYDAASQTIVPRGAAAPTPSPTTSPASP